MLCHKKIMILVAFNIKTRFFEADEEENTQTMMLLTKCGMPDPRADRE